MCYIGYQLLGGSHFATLEQTDSELVLTIDTEADDNIWLGEHQLRIVGYYPNLPSYDDRLYTWGSTPALVTLTSEETVSHNDRNICEIPNPIKIGSFNQMTATPFQT